MTQGKKISTWIHLGPCYVNGLCKETSVTRDRQDGCINLANLLLLYTSLLRSREFKGFIESLHWRIVAEPGPVLAAELRPADLSFGASSAPPCYFSQCVCSKFPHCIWPAHGPFKHLGGCVVPSPEPPGFNDKILRILPSFSSLRDS